MRKPDPEQAAAARQQAWSSLALLGFGLVVLAFLVAIERPHWFHARPASGAAAMAYAAAPAAPTS